MKVLFYTLFWSLTGSVAGSSACTGGWDILQSYDLFAAGNVWTSSDVEGKTFIGGDLTSSNSANFAIHLSTTTDTTLEIAGGIVGGNPINLNKGSLAHSSSVSSYLQNPAVGWNVQGRMFNINDGNSGAGASADADITNKASSLANALHDLSAFLMNLDDTVTVTLPGSSDQPQGVVIAIDAVDEAGVAVLTLNGNNLFDNDKVQQLEIQNTVGASLVVINVGGTSINWNHGNMVGSFLTSISGRSMVIWNFFEATSIDFKSKNMMGNVVAPNASVNTQANIDGATAVGSFHSMSEVHFPLLSVECPYTVTTTATTAATTTTEATTTTTTNNGGGAGGDPHIQLWGGKHISFHGQCDLVLVQAKEFVGKGLDLHIRTTIDSGAYFSYIETAALRVGENTLQFFKDRVLVNGVTLETKALPIAIEQDFFVSEYQVEAGKNERFYQNYKVELLGSNSSILFKFYKRFLTINVLSNGGSSDFDHATGLLGNYHTGAMLSREGSVMFDPMAYGFEWQVIPGEDMEAESLFVDARSPQLPFESCHMPTAARPTRRRMLRRDVALTNAAQAACAAASNVELCVEDCVATGDIGLAALW